VCVTGPRRPVAPRESRDTRSVVGLKHSSLLPRLTDFFYPVVSVPVLLAALQQKSFMPPDQWDHFRVAEIEKKLSNIYTYNRLFLFFTILLNPNFLRLTKKKRAHIFEILRFCVDAPKSVVQRK